MLLLDMFWSFTASEKAQFKAQWLEKFLEFMNSQ